MGVLKEGLGPEMENVWKQFANEIGGKYNTGQGYCEDSVEVNYQKWQITFDAYMISSTVGKSTVMRDYTRVRARFKTQDNFKLTIYRKGLLSTIGKLFGAQDIIIGVPDFDNAYIIKGTDDFKVATIFSNRKIRELVDSLEKVHLEITDDEGSFGDLLPYGTLELYYNVENIITDGVQLRSLFLLFCELLNELSKLSSATAVEKSAPV